MGKIYVAYGSNMDVKAMKERCPTAKIIGHTYLEDIELKFNTHATIIKSKGGKVPVTLWDIDEVGERQLDMYEGYPSYYGKEEIGFKLNGKETVGTVYIMRHLGLEMPHKGYVSSIERGYKDAGFNVDILHNFINKTKNKIKNIRKLCGENSDLYVAYGSNINVKQMNERCLNPKLLGSANLEDFSLTFKGKVKGVATIEEQKGSVVPTLIWKLDQLNESALDMYEGFPRAYRKENINFKLDGLDYEGIVYLNNSDNYMTPANEYYGKILKGYEDAGFDINILNNAVKEVKELEKEQVNVVNNCHDEEFNNMNLW